MRARGSRTAAGVVAVLLAAAMTACGDSEGGEQPYYSDEVVSFATQIDEATTRATTHTGTINNLDALKNITDGFGVFGYLTETDNWAAAKVKTGEEKALPDFMYNQSVHWGIQYMSKDGDGNDVEHEDWVYSPPKYWPNTTNNAEAFRMISFFAYAPFTATDDAAAEGATGITGFPDATTDHQPHVWYTVGDPSKQVDLLWASCMNAKRTGNGLISVVGDTYSYQRVPLRFRHALSCVDLYIQRIYDEETYTGKAPEKEEHTKLFVGKLVLEETSSTPQSIHRKGRLSLEDGTWSGQAGAASDPNKVAYTESFFSSNVGGTAAEPTSTLNKAIIRDSELDKWGLGYEYDSEAGTYVWNTEKVAGITAEERQLLSGGSLFFLPQTLTLTPLLTFSMVTRDNTLPTDDLTDKDGNRYVRLLNKDVPGNAITLTLEQGKRYKLLIHVGVETVRFEVVSIEDWDFPLRFTPSVEGFKDKEKEHTVDES